MSSGIARAEAIVARDAVRFADAVVAPIFQNSLFTFDRFDEMAETFAGRRARPVYTRVGNPTVTAFEATLAALEGAEAAVGFASGMGAISSAVLSVVRAGDRVVAVRNVYPDTYRFFEVLLERFGVGVEYVDGRDLDAVRERLPGAALLYLESPTSWAFEALDVAALAALAREAEAVSIIDNSWATPVFQRPLELGVDLVVHSASKFLGGHSDVVAGVVAGAEARLAPIRGEYLAWLGAKLAPMDAWLLVRGLRTLPVRLERIEAGSLEIVSWLAGRDEIRPVHHPLFDPDTGARREILPPGLHGCTGLFAVELADGIDVRAFSDALALFRLGVSWGVHESLACPAVVTHGQVGGPNHARAFGLSERLVRLNVGLEPVAALVADLERALGAGRAGAEARAGRAPAANHPGTPRGDTP